MSLVDWLTSDENVQTWRRFVVSQFIDNLMRTSEYVGSSRFERSPDPLEAPRPVNTSFSLRTSDLRHEDELAADDEWSEVESSDGQQRASNTPVEPIKGSNAEKPIRLSSNNRHRHTRSALHIKWKQRCANRLDVIRSHYEQSWKLKQASSIDSPLSSSITPSLFYSRLKMSIPFPEILPIVAFFFSSSSGLTPRTRRAIYRYFWAYPYPFSFLVFSHFFSFWFCAIDYADLSAFVCTFN